MEDKRLNPARDIINALGGADIVSDLTGKHISRVYRWMKPKEKGGTGGTIPQSDAPKLLEYAKSKRIRVSAADFFKRDEVAS